MSHLLAGVDLGGTRIKVAIADANCKILASESIPTESQLGPLGVIDRMAALVSELAETHDARLEAVGLGVPGLVDIRNGVTQFLPNLPTQWREVPVGEEMAQRLGCRVQLLNDVRTATLAELRFGHGRDVSNVTLAFFSIGTGIGGGVAIDGQLRLGPLGAAGELGHQTILPDGPRCGCGNRGCLETLASGPAIAAQGIRLMRMGMAPHLHELTSGNADKVTTREMLAVAQQDEAIHDAIITAATYIGIAAANVVTVLHPQLVVLGGGVAEIGTLLTTTVKDIIRQRVGMFPTDDLQVKCSQLGDQAGVMGAVALAADSVAGEKRPYYESE